MTRQEQLADSLVQLLDVCDDKDVVVMVKDVDADFHGQLLHPQLVDQKTVTLVTKAVQSVATVAVVDTTVEVDTAAEVDTTAEVDTMVV